MGLAERIAAENSRRVGQPLRVDVLLAELTGADRKAFDRAVRDPEVNARAIQRAMDGRVSETAVINWRRRNGIR